MSRMPPTSSLLCFHVTSTSRSEADNFKIYIVIWLCINIRRTCASDKEKTVEYYSIFLSVSKYMLKVVLSL